MDISGPVCRVDGSTVDIELLDKTFDTWVHTGRKIIITQCSPDSLVARKKLGDNHVSFSRHDNMLRHQRLKHCVITDAYQPQRADVPTSFQKENMPTSPLQRQNVLPPPRREDVFPFHQNTVQQDDFQHLFTCMVYPITRHVRGRAVLISNTGYQALRLLKDLFIQMNYIISIHTEKSSEEVRDIISTESSRDDNEYMDSFVVIIYGTPDGFDFSLIPGILGHANAPNLEGKPKLIYVIGDDTIVQQVNDISRLNTDTDCLLASTGFNGVMFYIYVLCSFVHELSAQDIWRLLLKFAEYHRFTASTHCTLTKEFYFFPGLTSSVMPDEIQNMNPGDMKLYLKMLEYGQISTYNIRLMFVGLYGAGKTCTARRMMDRQITDVSSTDGIDVYIGKCKVDIRNMKWQTIDDPTASMPYTKLSPLLFTDEKSVENIPDIKNLERMNESVPIMENEQSDASVDEHTTSDMEVDTSEKDDSETPRKRRRTGESSSGSDFSLISPQSSTVEENFEHVVDSDTAMSTLSSGPSSISDFVMVDSTDNSVDTLKNAYRVIQQSRKSAGQTQKEAFVSLWDFAGQFVYYATHQLFFSPRSIYLLVLNMEDDLDKTLNDWYFDIRGKQSIEAQGGVNFWLRSIYAYARGSTTGVPPIFLVGTHKDKMKGSEEEKKRTAQKYFNKIRTLFEGSPIAMNISHQTFLLDNTESDPETSKLKEAILNISKTMPYWGEKVPAKWVDLEQALDDRRREGRIFISMTELKHLDGNLARPIADEDQLRLFLKAHHEMGTLVYFGDSTSLLNVIVLDPQWIIHAFRYLIGAKDFISKYGQLQKQWEDFNDTGRLDVQLAENIWKQDKEHQFYENFELLLLLLEKLDIIARATVINEDGRTTKKLNFFYVPCLLKEKPQEQLFIIPKTKECISTPVLCFTFRDNFVPPAIFNRIVAICLAKWPIARQGQKRLLFCGCAVFEVNHVRGEDKHRMYIFFRKAKIGVRITRYSTRGERMVDRNICDRVRRVVATAVKKEFTRFHRKGQDEDEPFQYKIQCRQTVETEVLEEGLHDLKDLMGAIGTDFFCTEHSCMTEPHSANVVEMLHEWFPDEIPEGFRLEKLSVLDTWLEKLPDALKNKEVVEPTLTKVTEAIGKNWQLLVIDQLGLTKPAVDQLQENNPHRTKLQIFNALYQWMSDQEKNGITPTNGNLIDAMRKCRTVTIDWEIVRNVFDDVK